LLIIPSANANSYYAILGSLFVVALGFSLQQTCAQPFAISLGDPATGSHRLNLGGGVNSLGTTLGPIIVSFFLFGSVGSAVQDVTVKNINNLYVCSDYFQDDLTALKSAEIASLMDYGVKDNRSAFPVASFYYQSFSLSKNLNEKIPGIVLLALLFALSLRSLRSNNSIMYFSALALAGYEIILLLILQVSIGNMYQLTGLIIAGLMAGLAAGSGLRIPYLERLTVASKAWLLIMVYAVLGLVAGNIIAMEKRYAVTIILILSGFLPAVVTGNIFRDLTSGRTGNSHTAGIYGADLSGSAIGFIAFPGLAVPLLGISRSLFILPLLVVAGILFSLTGKKH